MEPARRGPRSYDGYGRRREPKPMPLGDKCNPLCPFFKCGKKALRISRDHYRGRTFKTAMCAWIGDKCIGATCRFAYCEKRAILPDGRCAFAVRSRQETDFEEELRREAGPRIRGKLRIDEDLL